MKLSVSLIPFSLQPVSAKGTLSIQLVDYNNPSSQDYKGYCCDAYFVSCTNECENYFKLFVAPYPITYHLNYLSAWKHWQTHVLGDDRFSFPGSGQTIGDGLTNPLTYHFDGSWPVRF